MLLKKRYDVFLCPMFNHLTGIISVRSILLSLQSLDGEEDIHPETPVQLPKCAKLSRSMPVSAMYEVEHDEHSGIGSPVTLVTPSKQK